MSVDIETRLDHVEVTLADMKIALADLKATQADIKGTLARLEPVPIKLVEEVAETKGRIVEQSNILQLMVASRIGRQPAA